MRYRRAFVPGGSFFFTAVTAGRRPLFSDQAAVDVLREAFRAVRAKHPFDIDAAVVLPDHLHCIWTLPPGDGDFSLRWRLTKTWFTKHCPANLRPEPGPARRGRGEQAVWQHRFWEHVLRDETDFIRHVEYIHYNPVKHGHASSPLAWPYSSFRRYVEAGIYPADWGQGALDWTGVGDE